MKKKFFHIVLTLLVSSFVLSGCFDENFSNDPNDHLTFSTDIVKFDTIFTQRGTATLSFKVYNHAKKSLKIESVTLADAANSGFFINVDGSKGPVIRDLEVRGRDSLYVFVEANVDPANQNSPLLIKDSIVFITNGVRQDVKLEAYGQDVNVLRGEVLPDGENITFSNEKPYLIYDSLVVSPASSLILPEGTTLYFHSKAVLEVKGKVEAQGSTVRPVTFRGDRLDRMFVDLPYDYLPGQWGGIHIHKDSYDNRFDHVSMRGTSTGIVIDSSDVSRTKITFSNSVIHNSSNNLVSSTESKIVAWNCQFSNASGALMSLSGGEAEFIHCTFANYFQLMDVIKSPLLIFDRYTQTDQSLPLKALFANCIIIGNGTLMQPLELLNTQIYFNTCLFRVDGSDDENFNHCIWNGDPMFVATGDNYQYNFNLSSESSAAYRAGNTAFVNENTRTDLLGNPRLEGINPDVGAYQYVTPIE
ncbi:hypothetical protein [Coprobacter sp.]